MTNEPLTPRLLREWPLPQSAGSKRDRGDVLVVGGARATPGAAMLAGLAALRVGSGRLTLGVARSTATAVAVAVPESGVVDLEESDHGSVLGRVDDALADGVEQADVVLVGPGLDDVDETRRLLDDLWPRLDETALVLDAYALAALAAGGQGDQRSGGPSSLALTPNLAEAAQLLDRDRQALQDVDPTEVAGEIAGRYDAVVCLQGVVAGPDGRVWQSTTGHAGLATSGSGDVLAGAVAGLIGRGATPDQACCWAAYVHAVAGDRLAARVGPTGFLARELLEEIPAVLVELTTPQT